MLGTQDNVLKENLNCWIVEGSFSNFNNDGVNHPTDRPRRYGPYDPVSP
ncbi:hypothetical protein ACFLST_00845 [Chloroflexota bacterium]